MKPTSRPISEWGRSRPNPFLDECNAIALQPNLQSERALVGPNRTARLRLHAPPRLASPSRRERGECSAAEGHRRRRLRVRRRPAPPEPTGPRHRGRLAGDRPKKRNCAFTRSNSSRNLDFLNAFASPLQVVKRSNCAFSTVRGQRLSPAVDNDSLEVTTSTRSRTRSSRRDGRCACHMRARRLDDAVDGPRAPQSGAAQQEQPPWLHDVNHTYHRTHLLLSAALHDLTPHTFSR